MSNIDFVPIVVNRGNETVFIARNVKNRQCADLVGACKGLSEFVKIAVLRRFHYRKPCHQAGSRIRVFYNKLQNSLSADEMHSRNAYLKMRCCQVFFSFRI